MKWTSITQIALGLLPAIALAKLTPSQAGVHVIYSYTGEEPPEHFYELVEHGKVGGIVLRKENVHEGLPGIINKTQEIWVQSLNWTGTPLLIMTQQEGGQLNTLPGGPEMTAKSVGKSSTPEKTSDQMAHQVEKAFNSYQINTNMGPEMGVYREEGDFLDQDERSFSNDPNVTAQITRNFIAESYIGTGIFTVAKKFPGLGAAAADDNTDEGPVTIDVDLDTLQTVDIWPFENMLSQQVGYMIKMIMPSWAVYPALDPERPAGLSEKIIKGELRERLKFEDVVISDSIEAGALEEFGDDAERAVLAMKAGVDIILASSGDVTQGEMICDAIIENIDDDSDVDSAQRIGDVRELLNPGHGYK